jgi:hypothetical protein
MPAQEAAAMAPVAIATPNSPPFSVPLRYIVAGTVAFVAANGMLVLDGRQILIYYLLPANLSLTHLAILGWVTMMMMGALCQLAPVVFQTKLAYPRLVPWQFGFYLVGVIGLVLSFRWFWTAGLAIFGTMVLLAVFLFLGVMVRTLWRPPSWPLTGHYLAHSLGYLGMTVVVGIIFALDLHVHWFPIPAHLVAAHAVLGLGGWLTLTLMGVNYQLLPMFALVHGHDLRLGRWVLRAVNLGVSSLFLSLLFGLPRPIVLLSSLVLAGGIVAYAIDVRRMFGLRRRRLIDLTQKHTIASTLSLIGATIIGLRLVLMAPAAIQAQSQWIIGLVYVTIGGWISLAIMGQCYKIVPFLVWQHRYSGLIGRIPVPNLRDLYSERWASVAFWCYLAGFVTTALGLLSGSGTALRLGAALALAGSAGFACSLAGILGPHSVPASIAVALPSRVE